MGYSEGASGQQEEATISDLVINVRQVSSYPQLAAASGTENVLVQVGGLGGPYQTLTSSALVATALASGMSSFAIGAPLPPLANNGQVFAHTGLVMPGQNSLLWNCYWGTDNQFHYWNAGTAGILDFNPLGFVLSLAPVGSAGQAFTPSEVSDLMILTNAGAMILPNGTLTVARDPGAALEVATMGYVGANTVGSFNGRRGAVTLNNQDVLAAIGACAPIATQDWVIATIGQAFDAFMAQQPLVLCWNGRSGSVYLTLSDISCVFFQPGQQPITPTPPLTSNDYSIANTAWVTSYVTETIAGNQGLATQAWVQANTVASFNTRIGAVMLTTADITSAGGAPIASPQFSGIPTGPTAAVGNATSQLATTAFVWSAVQESTTGVVSWNGRTGVVTLDATDINNAGGALLNSPALTGVPTAPTASTGTTTTQLATCAFVLNEVQAIGAGVTSFNTRSGNVVLELNDIEAAGGAPIASPNFSGTPTVPTPASPVAATTTIANTNWVVQYNALNTVASFNGRIGAVTLNANDLTALGALVNPSVVLTGNPVAPTAAPTTNTTQIATCAFVQQALTNLAGVTVSPTPPTAPYMGQAWFNSTAGVQQLYVYTGSSFVPSSNLTGYLPLSGGQLTGSLAIGTPGVPTAPAPLFPTFMTGSIITSGGLGCNAYASAGSNWNYFGTGAGATRIAMAANSGNLLISTAPVGTAGAPITFSTAVTIDVTGSVTTQASTVVPADATSGGVSAIRYTGPNGMSYSINGYVSSTGGVNWRYLTAGYALQNYLTTAGALQIFLFPSGAAGAVFPGPSSGMSLDQTGALTVSGTIAASGSRISSYGIANNPSIYAVDTSSTGFAAGIWASIGSGVATLNFGQMNSTGVPIIQFGFMDQAGNMHISGTLSQGSDATGKTNISPITQGISLIRKLIPKSFAWLTTPNKTQWGFIAQDVEPVIPPAVTQSTNSLDNTTTLGLDATAIIAALVYCCQQLDQRCAALEAAASITPPAGALA